MPIYKAARVFSAPTMLYGFFYHHIELGCSLVLHTTPPLPYPDSDD